MSAKGWPSADAVLALALSDDLADFYEGSKYESSNDNERLYVEDMTDDERRCRRVNNAYAAECLLMEARRLMRHLRHDLGPAMARDLGLRDRVDWLEKALKKADERVERIRELDGE